MKTFPELKQELQENGFCTFHLSEYDNDYYQYILNNVIKDRDSEVFKEKYKSLKIDFSDIHDSKIWLEEYLDEHNDNILIKNVRYSGASDSHVQCNVTFKKFEQANEFKKFILNKGVRKISQAWFTSENGIIDTSEVKELNQKLLKKIYGIDENTEMNNNLMVTYFNNGCKIEPHQDGANEGRLGAILIYLNTQYDANDGGFLRLRRQYDILPNLGTVAILDFTKNDIIHEVIESTSEYGRYAILDFINFKNTSVWDKIKDALKL